MKRPKLSVFIATSLDGFIARKDGNIDWLTQISSTVPQGEDGGYAPFIATVDVLIMGRKTFDQVLTFGEWPYGNRRVIVLSRSALKIPEHLASSVSHSSENPIALVERLSREGANHCYIDGGLTIQSFLRARLVDEITLTLIPILLGEGLPLFSKIEADISLTLLSSRSFDPGFVQSKYSVNWKQ